MSKDLDKDFTLGNCLFGAVKLTKNTDPDKYKYSSYGIRFGSGSEFLWTDGSYGRNIIIFGYNINCTESGKRVVWRLHYNGTNSLLFVNTVKICQFKAKESEIKLYPLYLGNMSKDLHLIIGKKTD